MLISTEPEKLIDTKLPFQMNHASVCGTMVAAFMLDARPINAAFQSALSKDIVADRDRGVNVISLFPKHYFTDRI